jgi:hypothetical protein
MFNKLIMPLMKKEKVLIITEDYEIRGWLYNPGLSRANRFLSNLLNCANKNFVAVTNCQIIYKNKQGEVEYIDFLQLNMKYIILIRPFSDDSK